MRKIKMLRDLIKWLIAFVGILLAAFHSFDFSSISVKKTDSIEINVSK